jgi:tetratricopeptide (TPR) repeat protein
MLLRDVNQIKFILAGMFAFLLLMVAAVIILSIVSSKKKTAENIKEKGKELLDKGDLDRLIDLCNKIIERYPSHSYAHWYLGIAYYRKKDWRKSLNEFEYINNIEPGWREEYIGPYLEDVRREVKSFKPEIV